MKRKLICLPLLSLILIMTSMSCFTAKADSKTGELSEAMALYGTLFDIYKDLQAGEVYYYKNGDDVFTLWGKSLISDYSELSTAYPNIKVPEFFGQLKFHEFVVDGHLGFSTHSIPSDQDTQNTVIQNKDPLTGTWYGLSYSSKEIDYTSDAQFHRFIGTTDLDNDSLTVDINLMDLRERKVNGSTHQFKEPTNYFEKTLDGGLILLYSRSDTEHPVGYKSVSDDKQFIAEIVFRTIAIPDPGDRHNIIAQTNMTEEALLDLILENSLPVSIDEWVRYVGWDRALE